MKRNKQFLLATLIFILLFSFASCKENDSTVDTPSNEIVSNMMMSDVGTDGDDVIFGSEIKRKEIYSITFLDTQENALEDNWDISAKQDKSVLAWVIENTKEDEIFYDLYIASNGKVYAPSSCEALFAYYYNLHTIQFNNAFDTSYVTNMSYLFKNCYCMEELDLSSWNTSCVTDMSHMFEECSSLIQVNISTLDTSKVTDMSYLFYACDSIEKMDVTNLNTSNVIDISGMFWYCGVLSDLDVSKWDTSNVTNMSNVFAECDELPELDFSNWNVENVTTHENFGQKWIEDN